jgi:hypothetical protein
VYILFDSGIAKDNGIDLSCRVCGFDFAIDFFHFDHGDIVRCPNCVSCALTGTETGLFDSEAIVATSPVPPQSRRDIKML